MLQAVKQFFKLKETYIGIAIALAFQLIFFTVWLTAYDGVYDRVDQLTIAVVNEDSNFGKEIAQSLITKNQFKTVEVNDLQTAQTKMNDKDWNMVLHIPKHFTSELQKSGQANLTYYIDQAHPALSKQVMETAANTITLTVNKQAFAAGMKQLNALPDAAAAQSPKPDETKMIAGTLVKEVQEHLKQEPITQKIEKSNQTEGFAATMIPLLVVLASFVGAMIMSQQIQLAAMQLRGRLNKWAVFAGRVLINLGVAVSLSLITLVLTKIFDIDLHGGLMQGWLFQSLLFFTFLSLSQMFVMIFGNGGMLFNIIAMATQLVSSGAIVPRELLSDFYEKTGNLLPATYGVNGYFSMVFGGGHIGSDAKTLAIIAVVLFAISAVAVLLRRQPDQQGLNETLAA